MTGIRRKLAEILDRKTTATVCDTCAFVEFFRSNGDGQVPRLHTFCGCPGGPFEGGPVPPARRCNQWQRTSQPAKKPEVGDPTLTA